MAVIDLHRRVRMPAREAFERLTDFPTHSHWVPFTTVRFRDPDVPGGAGFVARTAVGPFGFDDVNVLRLWRQPGRSRPGVAQLDKAGLLVRGSAELTVTPAPDGVCEVAWHEEIRVLGIPWFADPVVALSSRLLFGRLLRGLFPDTA